MKKPYNSTMFWLVKDISNIIKAFGLITFSKAWDKSKFLTPAVEVGLIPLGVVLS